MAGPGRPGPARKGGDEVEYLKLKGRVLALYAEGSTHAEIAAATGLERSAVTKMIPKAKRDVLTGNDRTLEALFLQYSDLDQLGRQLLKKITSDESGPNYRDVNAMLEILRAKTRLFPFDLFWPPGTNLPLWAADIERDEEMSQSPAEMSQPTAWSSRKVVDEAKSADRGDEVTGIVATPAVV
jgi:hypothetical protein